MMAEGLRFSIIVVVLLDINWTYSENIQKCTHTPMKQIICEFGTAKAIPNFNTCLCTHIAIPVSLESEKAEKDDNYLDILQTIKSYRQTNNDLKSLAAISIYMEDVAKKTGQICKEIIEILNTYDGVQLDLRQSDVSVDKSLIVHFFKELFSEIDNNFKVMLTNSSLEIFNKTKDIQLVLPPSAILMTKYYDLKKLSKFVNFFIIATHNLVDNSQQGYTYHPSRLMGSDDLLNADSLVDLIIGLGVHQSSILLSLPSTAIIFELKDPTQNTPRSPTNGLPTTITRHKMCEYMKEGNWTIERDEDLTAPYAFMNKTWISFDDSLSVSIKGKYILLRDLAGAVITDVEALDWKLTCLNHTDIEPLKELTKIFTETARKSRSAQLLSLQEQLQQPTDQGFYFNNEINYSPYYIERVVTRDGDVHVIRKDAKTEFECSRQGYFRHPSGCNRFYRCVKFDQQSNYFTVYEYDCPDGLAFDEKVEVCVWPGSLSDTGACRGSSEIAPVLQNQFVCPSIEGYYADPENCRWFFACLDHAKDGYTPLTAYEFRCPFGLVFDEKSLKCDWEWKVESCGNSGKSYILNYGEQRYETNLLNTLYIKDQFIPYRQYNHNHPQYSIETYVEPSKFVVPYSTKNKPQVPYESTERYVVQNVPQLLYSSAQSYSSPNIHKIPYISSETYINTINPQTFYVPTTIYPSTKTPEFYESTESYATTSKPKLFYSSTEDYSNSNGPKYSYSSTETYTNTGKPQLPYGHSESYSTTRNPQFLNEPSKSYSTTIKPQFSYHSSESYLTTTKPLLAYNKADTYIIPNQSDRSYSSDFNSYKPIYNQFDGPLGILYHQQHDSEIKSQFHPGILLHQQNNFQSIPVNKNYDSHKNDIQYPPLKDYETYTSTQRPLNKIIPSARLYSENYSPSNFYLNPSLIYTNNAQANSYSHLRDYTYNSHKINEQYQPSYNIKTYSTTQNPLIKLPEILTYSQSNIHLKPTSKLLEDYSYRSSYSDFNEESKPKYSTTSSPYITSSSSNINFNDYHIPSTTQNAALHDASLYKDQFKSQFKFNDYVSRISNQPFQSTSSTIDYSLSNHDNSYTQNISTYPFITTKLPVFDYTSTSPTNVYKKISNIPVRSMSSKLKEYTENYDSSLSYPVITEGSSISSTYASLKYNPVDIPSEHTAKPTVNYYTPSSTVYNDDSIFVEQLISKLSKTPISPTYPSSSTPNPLLYVNIPSEQSVEYKMPNNSFDIDEYIAKLSESIENSTSRSLYSSTSYMGSNDYTSRLLPTSMYYSSTETPNTHNQKTYSTQLQSTTYKSETSSEIFSPKIPFMPSLESVFSVRPPITYTQRPETLGGYSSTVSDLIDYYRNVHSSLDSAYRSPLPRYYALPAENSLHHNNYSLPREYEKDASHDLHAYPNPVYPLQPIIVEPVSPELNAEFERYYTAGVRKNLKSEDNGKVLVVGDTNPLLVGKLGAQCDCTKKRKPLILSTTTQTIIENDNNDNDDNEKLVSVKEVETKTKVVLEDVKKAFNQKLCTRAGLFRDPKQCNKFYSCNWDKWTQKYELNEFKCPIHLAFDENLSACNWPSKGPACSHNTLISYTN